jgi:hypothetical protein
MSSEYRIENIKECMDLTCWYINNRRVFELLGTSQTQRIPLVSESEPLASLNNQNAIQEAFVSWLQRSNVEPLGKLLVTQSVREGDLFTHHDQFFFNWSRKKQDSIKPVGSYAKLDHFESDLKLRFEFHTEHLTSQSARGQLSGSRRLFMLGSIQEIKKGEITCLPYVIANFVSYERQNSLPLWPNYNELHVDSLDSFSKIQNYHPTLKPADLNALKKISEKEVKIAFAEIINEPDIPKDWGGESSDLFSSRVIYEKKRISTAFLLKGPSKFKPMTMKELGKKGDQINRLFDEPALLFILQHCHRIETAVIKTMKNYSQQIGSPKLWCVINGYDTLRILEAYEKCGLSKRNTDS